MTTDPNKKTEIGRLSLRHGLLIGAISVVLSVVLMFIDPLMVYTNLWVQFLSVVVTVTLLVVLGIDVRKKVGGYWTFGEAYQSLIIMALFIVLISTVFNFIHMKYIDPEMPSKIADAVSEVTIERLEKMHLSQEQIDEVTKQFESGEFRAKFEPTFKNQFSNFGFGLLIYAIINLIVAACIKKNKPLYPTNWEDAVDPTIEK